MGRVFYICIKLNYCSLCKSKNIPVRYLKTGGQCAAKMVVNNSTNSSLAPLMKTNNFISLNSPILPIPK